MKGECTPEQKEVCPLANHFSDSDHTYWPASAYTQPIEKAFRNLSENIVQRCRYEHNNRHANETPPEKPSPLHMAEAIVRSEVHMTRKVSAQVADVMERQQEVMNRFWRGIEERRA